MRVMFWYCNSFAWTPTLKTLDQVPDAIPGEAQDAVVAFIHVEPQDVEPGSAAETKLVKNAKWLARKWEVKTVLLHSFTHLGEQKADPDLAGALIARAGKRLGTAGYNARQTAYGHYNDLAIKAKGHPLARIYKEF